MKTTPPRFENSDARARAALVRLAPVLVCSWLCAVTPHASQADAPLQLGSEQIGMTAESLSGTASGANVEEAAGTQPRTESEWSAAGGQAADPWEAPAEPRSDGPIASSYDECVEVAVHSGNGFSAASGVCQALFPEPDETPATTTTNEASSASDGAPAVSAPDAPAREEPLVLRLDGTSSAEPDAAEGAQPQSAEPGAAGDTSEAASSDG